MQPQGKDILHAPAEDWPSSWEATALIQEFKQGHQEGNVWWLDKGMIALNGLVLSLTVRSALMSCLGRWMLHEYHHHSLSLSLLSIHPCTHESTTKQRLSGSDMPPSSVRLIVMERQMLILIQPFGCFWPLSRSCLYWCWIFISFYKCVFFHICVSAWLCIFVQLWCCTSMCSHAWTCTSVFPCRPEYIFISAFGLCQEMLLNYDRMLRFLHVMGITATGSLKEILLKASSH